VPQGLNIDVLVNAVAKKAGVSRATASKAVEAVLEAVPEALAQSGDRIISVSAAPPQSDDRRRTREQLWSAEFAAQLLAAFRGAVAVDLEEHRAANRTPPVIPRR
jgi:DNA-binding protein